MKHRGAKPRGKVNREWSPELAYALGLIATDGCLYGHGRHVNFTSKDLAQVETFRRCLGIDNKVSLKSNGISKVKKYYYVQFGDVLFCRWLVSLGITGAKSKTLGPVKIPIVYYADFLRGCFDGDGTVTATWDKRWKSSLYVTSGFASASLPFLRWLRWMNGELFGIHGSISVGTRVWNIRYCKQETHVLMQAMHYQSGLPHLARKHDRYLAICELDR